MSQIPSTLTDHSHENDDTLIGLLRAWGVEYLMTIERISPIPKNTLAPIEIIKYLAQQNDNPRIRDASISLFLLHPELADTILKAIKTSALEIAEQITTSVLAALYLQRMWSIRLALALGHLPDFPEQPFTHLWQKRKLPPPERHNGEWGLVALQAFEQKRTGMPFAFIIDWQNQLNHLLYQEEAHHRVLIIPIIQLLENEKEDCQELEMSMRPNVDKSQIEDFLKNLGRAFRKQGRLYLVGGAALVHLGVRGGSTQDIDIEIRSVNEDEMSESIRRLKDTMKINVEFASPSDFIPIPSQWETNAKYVGRYGSIDVFYFDFYSIALSKIERGSTSDINDVMLLVQQGIIALQELDNAYNEVLPRVGKRPYNRLDPQKFAEHYTSIRQLL
ncbi:MAG: hypothetical protein PVS3B3_23180 [Ktedonobacteraceae bacterium]